MDLVLTLTGARIAAPALGFVTQRRRLSPIDGYLAGALPMSVVELFTLTVLVVALGIAVTRITCAVHLWGACSRIVSSAMTECAKAAPARISAATQIASMISCSVAPRRSALRVSPDAVSALRYVSDRHRDELLHLRGQRSVGEDTHAELVERRIRIGRKLAALLRELL